jgi:hypothetical protein
MCVNTVIVQKRECSVTVDVSRVALPAQVSSENRPKSNAEGQGMELQVGYTQLKNQPFRLKGRVYSLSPES